MCNAIVQLQQEVTNIPNLMSKHCQSSLHAAWILLVHALWYVITCWFEVHRHSERIYEKDVVSCVLSAVDWLAGPALFVKVMSWRWGDTQERAPPPQGTQEELSPTCNWLAAKPKENTCWWGWGAGPSCPPPPTSLYGEMWGPEQSQRTNIAQQFLNTSLKQGC